MLLGVPWFTTHDTSIYTSTNTCELTHPSIHRQHSFADEFALVLDKRLESSTAFYFGFRPLQPHHLRVIQYGVARSHIIIAMQRGILSPRVAKLSPRQCRINQKHAGAFNPSRYEMVRFCAWKGKNGMWAAEIRNKHDNRRQTIGYYKTEQEASIARKEYYDRLAEKKKNLTSKRSPRSRIEGNADDSLPDIRMSPRSPRDKRDGRNHNEINHRKFQRYHQHLGKGESNPITQVITDKLRSSKQAWDAAQNFTPYNPLFKRSTNDWNVNLMEIEDRLRREREVMGHRSYNNVFKRQHKWHPHSNIMVERIERHFGHEDDAKNADVPNKHKHYVKNLSHVNIWDPLDTQDASETYLTNLKRRSSGAKLILTDKRVIHPFKPRPDGRSPTPPTKWPSGCNRRDQNIDLEKLKGYN